MTSAGNKLFTVFGGPLGYSFQNATAETRVAELEAAGATLTDDQKGALDDFHVAKAAASGTWGASILRLWLPVMGVEAANAIDIIDGNTGTFNGTVTHAEGYVRGDGSSGCFRGDRNVSATGWTTKNAFHGFLCVDETADAYYHATYDNAVVEMGVGRNIGPTQVFCDYPEGRNGPAAAQDVLRGIVAQTLDATTHRVRMRKTSGVANLNTRASAAATVSASESHKTIFMGRIFLNSGGVTDYSPCDYGAFFEGTNMTSTNEDAFTLALKNLYETFTGNTLP